MVVDRAAVFSLLTRNTKMSQKKLVKSQLVTEGLNSMILHQVVSGQIELTNILEMLLTATLTQYLLSMVGKKMDSGKPNSLSQEPM